MTKKKQLTESLLTSMVAKLHGTRKITILGEFEHNVHVKFLNTDVQSLVIEYYTALQEMGKKEGINNEIIVDASSLLNILMIKYFTDIPVEAVGVEALIKLSKAYNNLGIFDEMFDEVNGFTKEQIDFVTEKINKAAIAISNQYAEIMANPELAKQLEVLGEPDGFIR